MRPENSTPELRTLTEMVDRRLRDLPPDDLARGVVAADLGGADSCALLLVLAGLTLNGRIRRLHVAHVDHGARPDSADDAGFVAELCGALDLDLECRRVELGTGASENAMRVARYAALQSIAQRAGAGVIATGHHADDDVETLLFRLRRGSGLRGLAGIPAARRLDSTTWLCRPLLTARRGDLASACRGAGVAPRIDPTNADRSKSRNWIRHAVIPALDARDESSFDLLRAATSIARAVTDDLEQRADTLISSRAHQLGADQHLTIEPGDDPSVLEECLRRFHLDMLGAAPQRTWLHRATQLSGAPPGRRLDGRPPTIAVERTPTGLLLHARLRSVASRRDDLHTLRPSAAAPSRRAPSS